jgi:SPP1 family predicted phage head-tail adaptor
MPASTRIKAGELRHRIVIVKPTIAQDTAGGWQEDTDKLGATTWAKIEALSGRELYAAQQKVSEVTHRITVRWCPGIASNMNVWFENRLFQIQAVSNPDERHKMLELLCIERDDSSRDSAGSAP